MQVLSLPSQSCVSKVKITETSTVASAAVISVKGMITDWSCNNETLDVFMPVISVCLVVESFFFGH